AAIQLLDEQSGLIAVGTQDGTVCLWDLRDFRKSINSSIQHRNAVSASISVFQRGVNDPPSIASCGSDKRIVVLDAAMNWNCRATLTGHQAPVQCSCAVELPQHSLLASGGANGWLVVHDVGNASGDTPCLYASGVCKGGVRCVKTTEDKNILVAAGDDVEPVVLNFSGLM
ncbi:MAG: hypothetical protein EZS28_042661, partial [Streblomastix strix]